MTDANGSIPRKAVQSEMVTFVARIVMPIIVTASLAIAAWSFNRLVGTLDKQDVKLEAVSVQGRDTASEIRSLKDTLAVRSNMRDGQITEIRSRVDDHEQRIRIIEHPR